MDFYYTGQIVLFAGNYAPEGFVLCDGRSLQISEYQALFSLIGNIYGGDGRNTFNAPDLRGRVALGVGQGSSTPATGGGTPLTSYALGAQAGSEDVSLTPAQLPPHNHTFYTVNTDAVSNTPGGNMLAKVPSNTAYYLTHSSTNPAPTTVELGSSAITTAGASQSHKNIMPVLPMSYIICVQGLYPNFS